MYSKRLLEKKKREKERENKIKPKSEEKPKGEKNGQNLVRRFCFEQVKT